MKKRIFMLLMAMVMMLGMTQSVFADETKYFEAVGQINFIHGENDFYSVSDAMLEYSSEYLSFTFSIDDIEHNLLLTPIAGSGTGELVQCDVEYDGIYKGIQYSYYYAFLFSADYKNVSIKLGAGDFFMDGYLELEEVFSEAESHHIATALSGSTTTDSGNYIVTLAGYFTSELTNGTHVLSSGDIASQSITVVVVNITNGEMSILNQSSINGITVTVSGGAATQFAISGSAQTASGSADTYTAIINP